MGNEDAHERILEPVAYNYTADSHSTTEAIVGKIEIAAITIVDLGAVAIALGVEKLHSLHGQGRS